MIPAWHAAGCLTWCCWGIYSVVETCSIPQTLLHSTTVRRIYHGPKNWPRLNENFLVKRGKKNTAAAAAAQVIVRQEHYVLECMRKPQMCSSFSPFDFSSSRSPTFTFIYHFLSTLLQVFDRFLVITDTWNPHQHVDASNCSGTRPKWKPSSLCPRIYFVIVLQMNQTVGIS